MPAVTSVLRRTRVTSALGFAGVRVVLAACGDTAVRLDVEAFAT